MFSCQVMVYGILLIASSTQAWTAPERCQLNSTSQRFTDQVIIVTPTENNTIQDIADEQNERLNKAYSNYKIFSLPIRGYVLSDGYSIIPAVYHSYAPTNCTFYTQKPSSLASVSCHKGITCALTHLASSIDYYTASEGYKWGVKLSSKLKSGKVLEIGGEASTAGGEYSCARTKEKTVADMVSCTDSTGKGGTLRLYKVQTELRCLFGKTKLLPEWRNGRRAENSPEDAFTVMEREEMLNSSVLSVFDGLRIINYRVLDMDKMSSQLFDKFKKKFPDYNPYIDLFFYDYFDELFSVFHHRIVEFDKKYEMIIPFTNEEGEAVYRYACIRSDN